MRSGWRHVLRIWLAKAAEPPSSIHALFKGYETAIRATAAHSTAVNRAPRIVLIADNTDANSQHEQQEPPGPRGQRGEAAGVGAAVR